jgi:hypothetical protein
MLDLFNDWMIFDNTEIITITNKGAASVQIPRVIRRSSTLDITDAAGNVVNAAGVAFIIWKVNAPSGFIPKLNAQIVDKFGKKYYVDSVNDGTLRSRWYVRCTSEANQGTN